MNEQFTAINYVTSYGEHCTATKNNGIVTIQGDKHGVRQMPINEFMECFTKDQAKVQLERTPVTDEVQFSSVANRLEISDKDIENFAKSVEDSKRSWYDITQKHTLKGNGLDVLIKETLNGRSIEGKICGKEVNLKIGGSGLDFLRLDKGCIKGTVGEQKINVRYKGTKNGLELLGLPKTQEDITMQLAIIISEKIQDDIATDNAMAAGAIMSGKV